MAPNVIIYAAAEKMAASPPLFSADNWIALYAAILSTATVLVGVGVHFAKRWRARQERNKLQIILYFLTKVDRATKEKHPIVVVLAANLGSERVALKSLEYQGIASNGLQCSGACGWYEQPEELFGIRNRLLPLVLASGETVDLPMLEIGVITNMRELRIWLTDFDERKYYIADSDIEKMRREIQRFQGG